MAISKIGTDGIDQTSSQQIGGISVGKGGGNVATNTAVGASALAANTTGGYNTSVGYLALTTISTAYYNVAVGGRALQNSNGDWNTGVGTQALYTNSSGTYNTAFGASALYSNTTASYNTAVGYQAGYSNTVATLNAFFGYQAGYSSNRTADTVGYNTLLGSYAGYGLTTGQGNTFVGAVNPSGYGAGHLITTGSKNTILGAYNGNQGGLDIRTANNYIVLSDGDGNPRGVFDNSGNFMVSKTSTGVATKGLSFATSGNGSAYWSSDIDNTWHVYNWSASAYRFYVSYTGTVYYTTLSQLSDAREKENIVDTDRGLSEILALRPVKFDWKDGTATNVSGFIAQEMQQVIPEFVDEAKHDEDGNTRLRVSTSELIPVLVKAIQELKAEFDAYKEAHP